MPRATPPEREDPTLEAAVGRARAAALRTELASAGFEVVSAEELAELRRKADGFRRMRSLAFDDDA